MMKRKDGSLAIVLAVLGLLSILLGVGYFFVLDLNNQIAALAYIAVLYMPTPLYALLITSLFKKDISVAKYIKQHNLSLKGFGYMLSLFYSWAGVSLLLTFALSYFFPDSFAEFTTTSEQLLEQISVISPGTEVSPADLPPSPLLLIPIGLISALTGGLTINALFAFGEEVLWRGFMWEKLKEKSDIFITLFTGFFWGIWHVPLILQGYNYGQERALVGSVLFILFCISFSYLFVRLMRKTNSTILASGLHGMFNAFAGIYLLVLVLPDSFIDGAIGLVSILSMVIVGALFYLFVKKQK